MKTKELQAFKDPKERLSFLKENKAEILAEKKSIIKTVGSICFYEDKEVSKYQIKSLNKAEDNTLLLDVVGNSVGFFDSHLDVSMKGSFNRTVKGGAKNAPFLKDHNHSTDGIIGLNKGVRVEEVLISRLGYEASGKTECFIMSVEPKKVYDEKAFEMYKDGQIQQHSIGLQYVKLALAMNDPDFKEEYAEWEKSIDTVINRDIVEEYGFFYPVYEQKVIELSAVLFASNKYTPILGTSKSTLSQDDPLLSTQRQKDSQKLFYQKLLSK